MIKVIVRVKIIVGVNRLRWLIHLWEIATPAQRKTKQTFLHLEKNNRILASHSGLSTTVITGYTKIDGFMLSLEINLMTQSIKMKISTFFMQLNNSGCKPKDLAISKILTKRNNITTTY